MNLGLGGMSAARGQADEEFFGSAYDQRVILRLAPYIKPYATLVIVSLVSMLIYTFTLVAVPWLIQWGIDNPIKDGMEAFGRGDSLDEHIRLLNILFAVFVINALTNWGTNYLQQYACLLYTSPSPRD